MAYGTVNADVIGTSVANSNLGAGNATAFKNRIINGAMVIDQRNAGALYTTSGGGDYTLDRWSAKNVASSGVFQTQQNLNSVTPPSGFSYYLGVKPSTAASTAATDCWYMQQLIEGYNINDLAWGTASAKTITISFWVYSNIIGTYGGFLANNAANRCYVYSYTINTANTWQQISITIPGDTSGTWTQSNGNGMFMTLCFGAGSNYTTTAGSWGGTLYRAPTGQTSIMGSTSNVFYFTGVQLEVGSVATGFDYRDFGRELILCQRYFEKSFSYSVPVGSGSTGVQTFFRSYNQSTSFMIISAPMKVTKRTNSVTMVGYDSSGRAGKCCINDSITDPCNITLTSISASSDSYLVGQCNYGPGLNGFSFAWTADAEL